MYGKNLKVCLHDVSTIQAWLTVYNLKTGTKRALTQKLKMKFASMQEEREYVALYDEISVGRSL